jgi:uncharacterized integral membrane protein
MMKLLLRLAAAILFVVFFGFAVENTQEVTLHFFLNYEIHSPLVLMLLGFFVAMTPTVFRHRRDLSKHQMTISTMKQENQARQAARANPPQPDSVVLK